MALQVVYLDLDGTLLGRGASLLRDGDGVFSLLGARALEACARAGVQVVLCSGRRRSLLEEDARLLGVSDYVFEAGAGFVIGGEVTWLTEARSASIEASGAVELLLDAFGSGLRSDPTASGREVSHLFRGSADVVAADALLAEHGHGHLRLLDNGAALHLVPREVSKARAVAGHLRARGWAAEEAIAVGDSAEDLAVAEVVGTFWLVYNADADLPLAPNARRTEAGFGAGVYEVVLTTLAEGP
jgi:phosphoglycolate phosphatase